MSNELTPPLPTVREFDRHDRFSTKTYRRNLPHWELQGSTYFITIRVDAKVGKPFQNTHLAMFMMSSLLLQDNKKYLLHAYVIMPDHIHLIIKPILGYALAKIMQQIKGSTAYSLNQLLNRTGKFWQCESFDHLIRDAIGLREKWDYIKENPVKANLVDKAENYPFSSFYIPK